MSVETAGESSVAPSAEIYDTEKPIPFKARESKFSRMFRPKQSPSMRLESASIHVVIRCKLIELIQKYLIGQIDRPEHLEVSIRMRLPRIVINARGPSVAGPADRNVPKMHVFGRVIRGLGAEYTAADANKYGHAEARKRREHWAFYATRVDVTGHSRRASCDNDIVVVSALTAISWSPTPRHMQYAHYSL
ncbi:hypothetical protein ACKVWC_003426 [Pyricularia oryzae]